MSDIPTPTSNLDCVLTDPSVALKGEQRREFVLSMIRVVRARAQLTVHDVDFIGCGLKDGVISPAQAVLMLRELGVDDLTLRIPPDVTLGAA
jgi:hypothetical protein